MFKPQLGASLHTLGHVIDEELSVLIANSKIKTLELLQWSFNENPSVTRKCVKILSAAGIKTVSIHADFWGGLDISAPDQERRERSVRNAFDTSDLAAELGASMIVIHSNDDKITPDNRRIRKKHAMDSIRRIAAKCEEREQRLAIELLPGTCLGNHYEELVELAGDLPRKTVGFCIDTNHLDKNPSLLPETVKALRGRIFNTHLSDYDGIDEKHWLPGTGVINWKNFMASLDETGYSGPFNFECIFRNNETSKERISMIEGSYEKLIKESGEVND